MTANSLVQLKKKDFETPNEVRWCPGCGDYAILATVQKFLPSLGLPKENFAFISGIGCSSRFPYYMNTYGFHTIHGRAPAVASGVKLANPDLSVWIITGDGDALSIGGNHLLHILRRNLDVNILLFNNRIYGLTKGQYSPTSEVGKVTKTTPSGSVDNPINPIALALGAEASFTARTMDVDAKHLEDTLRAAYEHKGTSFIEIYQNCVIFNDKSFEYVSERSVREEHRLLLKEGQLMIFGAEKNKGIAMVDNQPKVVTFTGGEAEAEKAGVLRFNPADRTMSGILSRLDYPEFPVPMGVLYKKERPVFEEAMIEQMTAAKNKKPAKASADENLHELFHSGNTWQVG
ncbi:MAG: 2-oxoacid:ferredoxin oxidoreductase subunit beta [bacterium]|nr:2-oxoacid:ferredoxin oxidoreductase subunit beta [bacterium]